MAAGYYQAIKPRDPSEYVNGTLEYPESASFAGKRGTPVVLDANGRVDEAGTTPTSIFGISVTQGHNTGAGVDKCLVYPMRQGVQWQITLLEALAQNMMGQSDGLCGILIDATTGYWYASTANGGAQFQIIDYLQGPAGFVIGDTLATVYGTFLTTKFQVL